MKGLLTKRQFKCFHRKLWWSRRGETRLFSALFLLQISCCWICKCMVTWVIWCKIRHIILMINTILLWSYSVFQAIMSQETTGAYWRCMTHFKITPAKSGIDTRQQTKCTLFSTHGNWIFGGCRSLCVKQQDDHFGWILQFIRTSSRWQHLSLFCPLLLLPVSSKVLGPELNTLQHSYENGLECCFFLSSYIFSFTIECEIYKSNMHG